MDDWKRNFPRMSERRHHRRRRRRVGLQIKVLLAIGIAVAVALWLASGSTYRVRTSPTMSGHHLRH
jgi:hypothetical protein